MVIFFGVTETPIIYLTVGSITSTESGQGTSEKLRVFPTFLIISRGTGTLSNFRLVLEEKISAKDFRLSDAKDLVTIKKKSNRKAFSVITLFCNLRKVARKQCWGC